MLVRSRAAGFIALRYVAGSCRVKDATGRDIAMSSFRFEGVQVESRVGGEPLGVMLKIGRIEVAAEEMPEGERLDACSCLLGEL